MLLLDSELSSEQGFKLINKVSLNHYLLSCVFAWQVLNSGAAGKFHLKLMRKSMNLFDQFFRLNIGRGKGLNSYNLGHVFVDDLVSNQLNSFEDSLSK